MAGSWRPIGPSSTTIVPILRRVSAAAIMLMAADRKQSSISQNSHAITLPFINETSIGLMKRNKLRMIIARLILCGAGLEKKLTEVKAEEVKGGEPDQSAENGGS